MLDSVSLAQDRNTRKPRTSLRALGLCVGGSSVSAAAMELPAGPGARPRVVDTSSLAHEGDPRSALARVLAKFPPETFHRVAVTGRRFHRALNLTHLSEPEAVEHAFAFTRPLGVECPAVVSAGGETFMAYVLDSRGAVSGVMTGNKCASGTGEFFLQQLRRMDVTLAQAGEWAADQEPYAVSGRCSVFCKSDCTHATNKGVPKPRVVAGLARMMAEKILELLKNVPRKNIMLVGGVARNRMVLRFLSEAVEGLVVPDEAPCFEALGAALWALSNETLAWPGMDGLYQENRAGFEALAPLADFAPRVTFHTLERGKARPGDPCILGLDVGSTTTKAVILRATDDRILASEYLRTNGDPVGASRACYRSLLESLGDTAATLVIRGLGVTGSGRQIAGLHAGTDGVVNEIIAHATAAVHFDPRVDTIFEIGGQDAKYTFLVNGVPADYAMNEACSAGTGSFLEESAWETLSVPMEEIAGVARRAARPPNFNDQCAAFIASDIKNAIHEGVGRDDVVAGLVYSICLNYANRVKGSRPVGERVFMQGGVCYNSAVPLAMASVCGKPIVVPPEPGLMGAFGVALEVKKRLAAGLLAEKAFSLADLVGREVAYGKSFTCPGGPEKCDRKCAIEVVRVNNEKHPFGGACNRYDNLRRGKAVQAPDLTRDRLSLVFGGLAAPNGGRRVGINRSFLTHTYFPLYSSFFSGLGITPVMPETCARAGVDRRNAPFCHPAELAHGYFHSLLNMESPPDFLFLPQFRALPDLNGRGASQTCPFVQGEPYFLRSAFADELSDLAARGTVLLNPVMDLTPGLHVAWGPLWECARAMGFSETEARRAFDRALTAQQTFEARCRDLGRDFLRDLEAAPDRMGVVLFGRPYNAFAPEAHKGIPAKLASRGVPVIPFDFLDSDPEKPFDHMFWGMGQRILKAARLATAHPQLFGLYVTHFSCGPDSFLLTYFRGIMGRKPSLTLELDSHTADAGIETRIEAFLDVVSAFRKLPAPAPAGKKPFTPARTDFSGRESRMILSSGEALPLTDPRVTLLVPSMGRLSSETLAAVFTSAGYHVLPHPPADEAVLKLGRANTSCKECLPLILTTGMLMNLVARREPGRALVYFLPTASGPCRFGQYRIFMEGLVKRLEIPDLAFWSPTSQDTYGNLSDAVRRAVWQGVIVSDSLEDARSMLLTNARDPDKAMEVFEGEWKKLMARLSTPGQPGFLDQVAETASVLAGIPLKRPVSEVPVVSLVGEIFVRRDGLSRQWITERLAARGMAVACAPVAEWILYVKWDMERQLGEAGLSPTDVAAVTAALSFLAEDERAIKALVSRSGLVDAHPVDLARIVDTARPHVPPDLGGEAVLTVGSALSEVGGRTCGAIAMGPFGCMPNRLSEALLSTAMAAGRPRPFLAVESDGSPFPQLLNARLEAFCLGALRLHEEMRSRAGAGSRPYPGRRNRNAQQVSPSEMRVARESRVPAGK